LVKFRHGTNPEKKRKGCCALHSDNNNDSLKEEIELLDGESWFFYWKISSSLWKSRIESDYPHCKRLVVPINWSLHHVAKDRFDFAQERPETNLKRLVHVANEAGKEIVFVMPLGPCPFIVNGGMPSHLAKSPAFHANLTPQKITNQDGSFNQLYSFYDPRVFLEYAQFANLLGQYLSRSGVASPVFSTEYGFYNRNFFQSLFEDWSETFEQAFFRYLQSTYKHDYEKIIHEIEENFMQRELREVEFRNQIKHLYLGSIEEGLAANYENHMNVHLLNGLQNKAFSLFPNSASFTDIAREVSFCHIRSEIATSVLLDQKSKNKMLNELYEEFIANEIYSRKFEGQEISESVALGFEGLCHFEVYDHFSSQVYEPLVQQNGLVKYLDEEFGTSYYIDSIGNFKPVGEESETAYDPVRYFASPYLDEKVFGDILRMFMDGHNIILDRSGMDPDLLKRLELFLLENNLNVEKVQFHIEVHHIKLGHGRLTVFKGHELAQLEAPKQQNFWEKVIGSFEIPYIKVPQADTLMSFWRTRPANTNELSYEEVRRLTLVNTTSYRKKLEIELKKNFVIKKVVGEEKVNVEHKGNQLNLDVMPGGKISIDMGVFSP
jgi:hypothetical protein